MMRSLILAGCALALVACGQREPAPAEPEPLSVEQHIAEETAALPEVDADALAVPNSAFAAIEPSEVGVQGAATIEEALTPLTVDAHAEEGGALHVSTRETGDQAVADIVRTGLADDSVEAAHLRIEFRREPEGWFPTNAYRRWRCRRGEDPGAWSSSLCP